MLYGLFDLLKSMWVGFYGSEDAVADMIDALEEAGDSFYYTVITWQGRQGRLVSELDAGLWYHKYQYSLLDDDSEYYIYRPLTPGEEDERAEMRAIVAEAMDIEF